MIAILILISIALLGLTWMMYELINAPDMEDIQEEKDRIFKPKEKKK